MTICGGSSYHIGAVAFACPRQSLNHENSELPATVSVICAIGHKDDEVARWASKYLASKLNCRVCVSAGIHIDDAKPEELTILLKNCDNICDGIITSINNDK